MNHGNKFVVLLRIQKIIAESGHASRRKAEQLIEQGRVRVNGNIAKLGDRAGYDDQIRIDNKLINFSAIGEKQVILLNKPEGYLTTRNDPENRKTVFELLPKLTQGRWINVGRLDINTSGLLLFTTDGQLANQLIHPSSQLEREYLCRIFGKINSNKINKLKKGIKLKNEDYISSFAVVDITQSKGQNHWVKVVLKHGKYREVRRLWQAVDCQVSRLIRIRFANLRLPKNLPKGQYRKLSEKQITSLENMIGCCSDKRSS